jgi:hypothetical protein
VAGFVVPVLPFAAPWPGLFLRSTVLDQVSRASAAVPRSLRLAHLTGLADVLNDAGRLTLSGNEGSLFARGDVTAAATWATGSLPVLLAVLLAALIGAGYAAGCSRAARTPRAIGVTAAPAGPAAGGGPGPLEWWALGTLAGTVAAVLGYSAFFYHYADFAAPWLAISAGYAVGALAVPRARDPLGFRRRLVTLAAAVLVAVAGLQAWELSGSRAPDVSGDATMIPPAACVVSDEISLVIAANRLFAGAAGCPRVIDSLATTLVAGNGVSVQGGAKALTRIAAGWESVFARADYVWLSGSSGRRIPWTPELQAWFRRTFRPLNPPRGEVSEGKVYVRRTPGAGESSPRAAGNHVAVVTAARFAHRRLRRKFRTTRKLCTRRKEGSRHLAV